MLTWKNVSQVIDEDETINNYNSQGVRDIQKMKHSEDSLESLEELYNNLFREI